MRQYIRPALDAKTIKAFAKWTKSIKRKRKPETKKAEATRLWENHRATKARERSLNTLFSMNGDSTRCMYCEHDQALVHKNGKRVGIVDHWEPQQRAPERTFDWTNHFLACKRCNSDLKSAEFPCDLLGQPLLLHPVDDNPLHDVEYEPSTGDFKQVTPKGGETIKLFQLNDFSALRKSTWKALIGSLREYDAAIGCGDVRKADEVKRDWLSLEDFRSILNYLVKIALGPSGHILTDPDIPDIVRRRDPLKTWR